MKRITIEIENQDRAMFLLSLLKFHNFNIQIDEDSKNDMLTSPEGDKTLETMNFDAEEIVAEIRAAEKSPLMSESAFWKSINELINL